MLIAFDSSHYVHAKESPRRLWDLFHESGTSGAEDDPEWVLRTRNTAIVKRMIAEANPDAMHLPMSLKSGDQAEFTRFVFALKRPVFGAVFYNSPEVVSGCDYVEVEPDGSLHLVDISAATSVQEHHLNRLAFAWWGAQKAGYRVAGASVLHIDSKKEPSCITKPEDWLEKTEVSKEVYPLVGAVEQDVKTYLEAVRQPTPPDLSLDIIGKMSREELMKWYPNLLRPDSPFCLLKVSRAKAIAWARESMDIMSLPEEQLSVPQRRQREAMRNGGVSEMGSLRGFLDRLEFPVVFYDFETVTSAIPTLPNTRPYEQMPYLGVTTRIESPGARPQTSHVLVMPGEGDPRKAMLEGLRPHFEGAKSTVAYSQSFEHHVLRRCAEAHPDHEDWVAGVIERAVDLHEPFQKGYVYFESQQGRTSLKVTAKVLLGEDPYEGMPVRNGSVAMAEYLEAADAKAAGMDIKGRLDQLVDYCRVDVEIMPKMVEKLEGLAMVPSRFAQPGLGVEMVESLGDGMRQQEAESGHTQTLGK
jgi:Domain of unknown function(DUF2779).